MTSIQAAIDDEIRASEALPRVRPPATLGEAWNSAWKRTALDTTFGTRDVMLEAYTELHDRLRDLAGEDPAARARRQGIDFDGLGLDGRAAALGRMIDQLPEQQGKLLEDYRDVRARAQKKAAEIERQASEVSDATYGLTGNTVAFLGGVARQVVDPVNLAMLPLGPARPAAGAGIGAVARWLGKEALTGAATQAVQEPFIARQRAELGLESNSLGNIVEAGIGQAGFAGLLHAGAAALRRLRGHDPLPSPLADATVNVAPDDISAAARVVERDAALDRMTGDPVRGPDTLERVRAALEAGAPIETEAATRGTGIDLSRPRSMAMPDGSKIEVQYGLADLSQIRASHTLDGAPNPDFPQVLQPRNRETAASQRWIDETAARLDPERLGVAPGPQEGAPVLSRDGLVESGNGRVLAIARAYERFPDRAKAYRDYLEELGFDTGAFKEPVLVRVRQNDFTPEQQIAFTRDANVAQTASLSPAERAKIDAGRMDDGLMTLWKGGAASDLKNAPFVQRFKALAVDRGEAAAFDPEGVLVPAGRERIRAALVARGWRDADLVRKVTEDLGDTSKSIVDAMVETAPEASALRAAIEEGRIAPEHDVITPMIRAFQTIEHARRTGKKLSALVDQADIERGMMPEADRAAVRLFFLDDGFTVAAGAETVANRIRTAIADALNKQAGDLFGESIEAPGLLRAARFADEPLSDAPISGLERAKARTEAAAGGSRAQANAASISLEEAKAAQPFDTLEEMFARAPAFQRELVDVLNEAGVGKVKDPGIKARDGERGIENKIRRKGYESIRDVTDVVRAGVSIEAPAEAEKVLEQLRSKFRVIDEGWKANASGYADRKIMVLSEDGMIGEVQLWERSFLERKSAGHAILEKRDAAVLAGDKEAAARYRAEERAFWSEVHAALSPEWREVLGGAPKAESALPNSSTMSSASIGRPSHSTSTTLTGSQPRTGDKTNASMPSAETTASRWSQSNSEKSSGHMETPSEATFSRADAEINSRVNAIMNAIDDPARTFEFEAPDGTSRLMTAQEKLDELARERGAVNELNDCIKKNGG